MNPVAIVTGGTSGIGLATAIRYARGGYDVAICGRDRSRLDNARKRIAGPRVSTACEGFLTDLSKSAEVETFAESLINKYSRIDVLVNAAAFAANTPFGKVKVDEFKTTCSVNMRAVFFLTQSLWPKMVEQKSGVIINISSLAAVSPFPGFSTYGSSKAWLDLFTVSIAGEGKAHGIRAYSIRPGAVETPMLRGLFPDFPAEQTVSAEEVAEVAWSLSDDAWRFSSGQAIAVTRQ